MAGHIIRLAQERPAKHAVTWIPDGGRGKRGRPQEILAVNVSRRPQAKRNQLV